MKSNFCFAPGTLARMRHCGREGWRTICPSQISTHCRRSPFNSRMPGYASRCHRSFFECASPDSPAERTKRRTARADLGWRPFLGTIAIISPTDNNQSFYTGGAGVGRCRLHPLSVPGLSLQRAVAMPRSSGYLCQEQPAGHDSLSRPGPGPLPWPGVFTASFGRGLLRVSSGALEIQTLRSQ
jgi:hypothetical protein